MIKLLICSSLLAVDGDTVKCDGTLLRPMGGGEPFLSGFDAPEFEGRADCLAERMLANLATSRMKELIESPGLTIENSGEIDNFGRPLVWLRLPSGQTVGEVLLKEGLAIEWRPGVSANWCD